MRRLLLLGAIFLGLAAPAGARGFAAGGALLRAGALAQAADATQPSCPAGVPVQTITVVNQANVRPWALAKVEDAVVAQSMQLRGAWGTPCVQFGHGGWPLYLQTNSGDNGNVHYYSGPDGDAGTPYAYVETQGSNFNGWSVAFSHEIAEMLVDPTTGRYYDDGDSTVSVEVDGVVSTATSLNALELEVADPVDERAYLVDGVYVTDFVLPAWFAGARSWSQSDGCDPTAAQCGALIAPASAAGPYDEMGLLSSSWQTTWEQPDAG